MSIKANKIFFIIRLIKKANINFLKDIFYKIWVIRNWNFEDLETELLYIINLTW